jgi:prepilin-type processing-associated H-X9-DG protein/prepilin-type N-terminal cleavage/methylation domain-containing protein
MRREPNALGRAGGFTLVELMVVVGIIGLLLAMLLPALSSARRLARQVECAATLHAIGVAMQMHVNDHLGYLPLAGNIACGDPSAHPPGLWDNAQRRYDYISNDGDGQNIVPNALPGSLSSYLGPQSRTDSWQDAEADMDAPPLQGKFQCPEDDATGSHSYVPVLWIQNQAGNFLMGYSSYGFNSEVLGWWPTQTRLHGKVGACPHPSDTMLMCDASPRAGTWEIWVGGVHESLADVYLQNNAIGPAVFDLRRHRGRLNILFVDGHVDGRPILSTGSAAAVGALGSPGNSPSGSAGLGGVSMNWDFH